MTLCSAWFVYWGRVLGMSRWETLHTRLGEMLEMLSCHAIAHGASPKKKRILTYDEAMQVR